MNAILNQTQKAFEHIGYRNLIKSDYEYTNILSPQTELNKVDLAIFGQIPFDYRSACFAIKQKDKHDSSDFFVKKLKAFGAPVSIIISNGKTELWNNSKIEILKTIETSELVNYIRSKKNQWNPSTFIRAKEGFTITKGVQLDFIDVGLIPALDHEAAQKIEILIETIFYKTDQFKNKYKTEIKYSDLLQYIFRLLAAKLISDREINIKPPINFEKPAELLDSVSKYYQGNISFNHKSIPAALSTIIAQEIKNSFPLKNLAVDSLTYIYENTFITKEHRKKLGIHSTPSYISDFIFSQIPIATIPRAKVKILDPTCGHGIFLISAVRKIRSILPETWTAAKRHHFLVNSIYGIEIDSFAVEVAKMCLLLSDFPEKNGWTIHNKDCFTTSVLENSLESTTVLVGNPPFEAFENRKPLLPKPVELLIRAFEHLPDKAFVGMVLPLSFLYTKVYHSLRLQLLSSFKIISLTTLPDQVFIHSDKDTVILIAQKTKENLDYSVEFNHITNLNLKEFRNTRQILTKDIVAKEYFIQNNFQLIVPLWRDIWQSLKNNPKIKNVAEIKTGVRYKNGVKEEVVKNSQYNNYIPGLSNISKAFQQYFVTNNVFLSVEKKYRNNSDGKSWDIDWKKPKIVLPTARLSRGIWKFAAIVDNSGLLIRHRFFGLWAITDTISLETIAAVMNSPISQAYIHAHSLERDILKKTYLEIPIPNNLTLHDSEIKNAVTRYINQPTKDNLLLIDAIIISLYNFEPKIERKVLDLFWGIKDRRTPFNFNGFIPPENQSWIPLKEYISDNYKNASISKTMERLPIVKDREVLELLKNIDKII